MRELWVFKVEDEQVLKDKGNLTIKLTLKEGGNLFQLVDGSTF